MKLLKYFFLLIVSLNILTSANGQSYYGEEEEIQKILLNIKNFSEYYVAHQAEKIAASYTKDGKIFPPKQNKIEGTAGLTKYWSVGEGVDILSHKVNPTEIRIVGEYAYDHGTYEGSSKTAKGISKWGGKYVIVWKKVGEEWKIYLDMWNQ